MTPHESSFLRGSTLALLLLLVGAGCGGALASDRPPADTDWTTSYPGAGSVSAHIHNGSADDLFVKIKDQSGVTVAQTGVPPNGSANVNLPSGRLRTLLRLTSVGAAPNHYEGPPLDIPDGVASVDLTLANGLSSNLRSISEQEFQR